MTPETDLAPGERILISGASGFVGRELCAALARCGHQVVRLVRRAPSGPDELRWDPAAGTLDLSGVDPFHAVIHLAGENIAGGRWTEARKARVLDSRVLGTRTLVRAISELRPLPAVLLSASATGFYGARDDHELDEGSAMGEGFLADTCRDWEAETRPAVAAGIRVCQLRTGVVLGTAGGALARMLLPFKLGLGGRLGDGQQWFSWISIEDEVRAIRFALGNDGLRGPVNLTAPAPVTNAEFTRALGRALRRPTWIPVPAFLLRLVLGREFADNLLLTGARVVPRRLLDAGFIFESKTVDDALRVALSEGSSS